LKSTGRITLLCLLNLILVLSTCLAAHARTTLGLAPSAYNLSTRQQDALTNIQGLLTESIGQPVTIRNLDSEAMLKEWLLRFRQVDAALMSRDFYQQNPAGALAPLVDVYLVQDETFPSLILVVAPGLDPQLRDAWQDAFLSLQADADTRQALAESGITKIVRVGARAAIEKPTFIASPTSIKSTEEPVKEVSPALLPQIETAKTTEPPSSATASPSASEQPLIEPVPKAAATASKPAPALAVESNTKGMGLSELIQLVVQQNQQSKSQGAQFSIKQAEEEKTHAIFEPDFVTTLRHEDNEQRNTVQETVNRLFTTIYNERNWDYSASLQGVAATGARYNLGYNYQDLSNTVSKDLTNKDHEYQMYLGLSLVQPLMKNAGIETTRTGINIARAETRASFHDYRQERMKTVGEAALIYWEYYQAQQKLKLRQDSVRIANQILNDNQERVRTGKMAETEVLEAMVGTASRQSLLSEAEYDLLDSANRLKSVLSINTVDQSLTIAVNETPVSSPTLLSPENLMQKAFELRPDYLAALERLNQADIKISYAQNQIWPELDLITSYGLNGLDFSRSDSWEQIEDADHASWAVGMEFRLPLQGGIDTSSDLKKSQLEKRQLLWELKDIEVSLANDIDTAVHKIASAHKRLDYANSIVAMQEQLLSAEMARLQAGKSQSRLVLEKEDDYRIAREEALENSVELQTALIDQELAEGSILLNNDVELTERDY
jgi:outer membrane protein TolC